MENEKMKKKSNLGGKRPGAGRKPGGKNKKTIEQQLAFEELRTRVLTNLKPLLDAQISLAKGQSFLYVKGKNKRPELVTSPHLIEAYLAGDLDGTDDYYYITTERPNNMAIDSMIDRVFGKAVQYTDITTGGDKINNLESLSDEDLQAIIEGRARAES